MTNTTPTPEAVTALADQCRVLGNKAHETPGDTKYMRALWSAETVLRALSADLAAQKARADALRRSYDELYADALADARSDAQEFEGDLWKLLRDYLTKLNLDWSDYTDDGITAEQAIEHIRECMDGETARADAAEAQLKAVLDREAETQRRHDAKIEAAEAKVAALEWFAEISGDEAMATKARIERASDQRRHRGGARMTAPLCEYCKQPTTDCGPDGYGGTDWWCMNPQCEGLLGFSRRITPKPLSAAQGVWPDFIAPPKHDNPDPRWQDPSLPDFRLIWKVARECGYSVGLHGSMKRDCDMIAAPWTDKAVIAFELIDRLCSALNAKVVGPVAGKPHGRLGWNLQVDGYVKVIDISVMPRRQDVSAAALAVPEVQALVEAAKEARNCGFLPKDQAAALRAALRAVTVGVRRYMGQIMAECDCPREAECQAAGRCIAEGE